MIVKRVAKIIDKVNKELESQLTPSAYRAYVFLMKDNRQPMFNDLYIGIEAFDYMKEKGIIEYCGETKHQGCECSKYKFTHVKYPSKILFDHKTKMDSSWCIAYNESNGSFHLMNNHFINKLGDQWDIIADHSDYTLSHSFVDWCSKKNDLSNQPDKEWGYVGKKPKLSTIKKDWNLFINAYDSINKRI